ncbi:MAG: T9SS type A sorting domain-containing protein, partial [Ignavibacteria bacterium]|nr:T9SS type A sorting domain-containing protein [Ignavibacteria bacterium]
LLSVQYFSPISIYVMQFYSSLSLLFCVTKIMIFYLIVKLFLWHYTSIAVNSSNDIFHLAWQENGQDICYAQFKRVWQGAYQVLQQTTIKSIVSAGDGFPKNYHPSIISVGGADNFTARLCWIGDRRADESPIFIEGNQKTVVFTATDNPGRYWTFGSNVNSVNINKCDDRYAIAWAQGNDEQIQFTDSRTLSSPFYSLNIKGKDVQLSNGKTESTMYALAFNTKVQPYYMQTERVYTNPKPIYADEKREGVVSEEQAQVYFNVGDVVVDEKKIGFVEIPDTASVTNQQTANQYLVSEPFSLNDNSEFFYSVKYGLTDSLSALSMLNGTKSLTFKVELLDAQTNEILGVFDDVTYDQGNLIPFEKIDYQVITDGIGSRIVKLRLTISCNFNPSYSVAEKYDTETGLAKKQYKQMSYKGSLVITEYALYQNYPNPFNPATTINYHIKEDGLVTLKLYDILGAEVKTLLNEEKIRGRYSYNFNASDLASGVYIYQLRVNDFVSSKKLLLMK